MTLPLLAPLADPACRPAPALLGRRGVPSGTEQTQDPAERDAEDGAAGCCGYKRASEGIEAILIHATSFTRPRSAPPLRR